MVSEPSITQSVGALGTELLCPIRGRLRAEALARDGLTRTEEARRIDFINFLLGRRYPKDRIDVETVVLKHLGHGGRNKLRCDVIVYDVPTSWARQLPLEERIAKATLVAEIKRDSDNRTGAIRSQLEPALRQLPGMKVVGAYWDDVHRLLFAKTLVDRDGDKHVEVVQDSLANLPSYGAAYRAKALVYGDLTLPDNLVGILLNIANVMRSQGVNDEHLRYKETVKLLLARYCDEREAAASSHKRLSLQVHEGGDPEFLERVRRLYRESAQRYNRAKTLFAPRAGSELPERTLRDIVRAIQGVKFTAASNQTMQQVFMSFVPAVFKKALDQYFTPLTLIEAMVQMVNIGPNDKVADPAMGTADFLTAAMEYRAGKGDTDAAQRVYGIDSDRKAYDLAIVNMILNKDGQANLLCEDSIEAHTRWAGDLKVVLCNPPFGERSVENRSRVLAAYDLGHQWTFDSVAGRWVKSDDVLAEQQLGILFIERSYKLLANGGRLAIILPEGYLCTPTYGYVRQWILSHLRVLSLIELPRRIFIKSDVDLRANVLVGQKLSPARIRRLIDADYPIHAELIRRVGFKMGKGHAPTVLRDPETGLEIRDEQNRTVIDSDFPRVVSGYRQFAATFNVMSVENRGNGGDQPWEGARVSDVLTNPALDLKPRRLMPRALQNIRSISRGPHITLSEIADLVDEQIDVLSEGTGHEWRIVKGQDIRAVEGIVMPQFPVRAWVVAEQERARTAYHLRRGDIVVGLVRPERRNVGMVVDSGDDMIGIPDGVAVVRVKPGNAHKYPQEWLFATLRSEACRLQLWTNSGGTSYGKLTLGHIRSLVLPVPTPAVLKQTSASVRAWAEHMSEGLTVWNGIGAPDDRKPILNSSAYGLQGEEE